MLASPVNLLLLFFCSQLLIYFDRGLISAVLPALSKSFLLSDSEMGLIGSCFIFGYMLACPLFAFFSRSYSVYKLMAIGLFLWSVAVLLCGLTNNFIVLLGARILTGVGEASFAGLAPACIDDVSPKRWRTLWLSFFYAGLPIGGAIGYIMGGELVHGGVVFSIVPVDWHTGFLLETAAMVPVIVTVFLWPDAPIAGDSPASPLSPPSPALLRRASTQIARYGSLNSSYSHTSRSQSRPMPFNRRVSAPPYGFPTPRTAAGPDFHRPRFASTLPPRTTTAPAPAAAFSSSSPSFVSDRFSVPIVDSRHERRETGRSASALSPSPPPLASTSAPSAPVLLSMPRGGQQESASVISSSPANRSSPSAISPHASPRVVYIPSTPPHRGSPFSTRRSPSHPTRLTVSTSHRALQTAQSQPLHPMLQSRSASNLHSGTVMSRPPQFSPSAPPPLLPAFSQQELVSPSLVPLPSSSSDSERLWYDIAWNDEQVQFGTDVTLLFADNIYLCVVLGYSALAFVIGALSFWAPVDFSLMLNLSIEQSTKAIGVITFFCGILGTGFGGWSLDWWQAGRSKRAQAVLASLELCVLFTSVSIGFGTLSIVVTRPVLSLALLAVSNFFLFSTSAPINACLLSCSPPDLRSLAMAMSILIMHLLGDLPSPLLMGWITDLCRDVRLSLLLLLSWLGWTVLFWSCGAVLARRQVNELKLLAISEGRLVGEETATAEAAAAGETDTAATAAAGSKDDQPDEVERKDRREDAEPKEVNGTGSEKEYGSWGKHTAAHEEERQPLLLH